MVILTSIVGEAFYEEMLDKYLDDIKILNGEGLSPLYIITNIAGDKIKQLFPNNNNVHIIEYPYLLWNYVDKIYFSFKLGRELNESVLWVDSNKTTVYESMIKQTYPNTKVLYNGLWNEEEDLLIEDDYWEPLIKVLDIPHNKILKIMEQLFFVPKNIVTNDMLVDILKLKGTLSYQSYKINFNYKGGDKHIVIGNGEGVILGYLIEKYKMPYSSFSVPKQNLI